MRPAVAIVIFAALPLSAALADVYRSVDAQGHVLYSDTPTPGAQLVRVTNSQTRYVAPTPSPGASKSTPPAKSNANDQLTREAAARAVQTDVAQTRADQCKKAQDAYQKVVNARRIYNEQNGERQYLSDADADQMRVNAKLQMDEACKDQ